MDEVLILLYIAYLIALGQVWLNILSGSEVRGPTSDFGLRTSLPWSFGVGTVIWGYGQFLLNVFNLPVRGAWFFVWQIVLMLAPAFLSPSPAGVSGGSIHRRMDSPPETVGNDVIRRISIAFIGVALFTAVLQAVAFPMHMWDSIVIYAFKAKILFYEQTFKTDAFMNPAVIHYSKDYPLLVPYLEAGYFRWLGHPDDRTVRLLFTVYWAAWMGILYECFARRMGREVSWGVIAWVVTLPMFSNIFMGQASSGFADIPFAFYWTGFLLCGVERRMLMAVLFGLGCLFTKNEGWTAVGISGTLLYCMADPKERRRWFVCGAAMLAVMLPWLWVRHWLPHNAAHYPMLLSIPPSVLFAKLRLIGGAFVREAFSLRSWGLFWPGVLGGLLYAGARCRPWPKEARFFLMAAGLQALVYVYVYLAYRHDLAVLLPTTELRLMLHLIGPLLLTMSYSNLKANAPTTRR